jgi:A/G-specific adenine glycosylase
MLQQTRVATAIPYYERFLARFPTLESLAAAREEEVLALWSGLGYYARGRNLAAAAREAVARHGGLPASLEALRALPGFGPYTAGAVASIAFAIPAAAVDGNVARVLARLEAVRGDPAGRPFRARIEALARALAGGERARPGDLNQAVMELGATLCSRRAPACQRCPLAALCAARRAEAVERIPAARRRRPRRRLALACAVVRRNGSVLLARRPAAGLFGGLWGPPAAELGPGEDARGALRRALRDGVGGGWSIGGEVAACERILTHRTLALRAFSAEPEGQVEENGRLRWVPASRLGACGMPSAFVALLAGV